MLSAPELGGAVLVCGCNRSLFTFLNSNRVTTIEIQLIKSACKICSLLTERILNMHDHCDVETQF